MASRSRSRSASRSRRRARGSRSRSKERRSRHQRDSAGRTSRDRDRKHRHKHSSASSAAKRSRRSSSGDEVEAVLRRERRKRREDEASGAPSPAVNNKHEEKNGEPAITLNDSPSTSTATTQWKASTQSLYRLLPDGSIDESSLPAEVLRLMADRVRQELAAQAAGVEAEVQSRLAKARHDIEAKTRHAVETELKHEVEQCQQRERESAQRCADTEAKLAAQMKQCELTKAQLDLERLEMLESKRRYESEMNKLKREKEQETQREQHAILNKGGAKRPPIKLTLGGGK